MDAINIIFEDDFLIAVDKPSGVVTHRGQGHEEDNLLTLLVAFLQARGEADTDLLAPVHRLDRGTSGIVVFGRSPVVSRAFQSALKKGEVKRQYLALLQGVSHRKGTVRVPLSRQGFGNMRRGRRGRPPRAKEKKGGEGDGQQRAETRYRRLLYTRAATLVRVSPKTGRPHQIRRHMRSIGHPIAGDDRWGDIRFNRWITGQHGLNRLFLHAASLEFPHPITGIPLKVESPLPAPLQAVLDSLEFPAPSEPDTDPSEGLIAG